MSSQHPYLLLSGPESGTSSIQLDSQLGYIWESLSPAQVATISDYFIAQAGWSWAKYRWGLTMACATREIPGSVHPGTATDHIGSTTVLPLQADPPRRARLVVSGYSQSLQLTGLSKSLPLICQQQPSLNYKRRVYSAHPKGAT